MKSKIDWPNHIVSFFLIIFSILLAFQVDKCASSSKENKLVDQHLAEIVEETRFNRSQLAGTMESLEGTKSGLDTLLQMIDAGADPKQINGRVLQMLAIPSFYLRTTAYQSLTTSGDIRLINDFDRKRDIVTLYEYHKQAEAFNMLLLDTYKESYFNYIKDNFDLHRGRPQPLADYQERSFVNGVSSYYYFVLRCNGLFSQHLQRMDTFIEENAAG